MRKVNKWGFIAYAIKGVTGAFGITSIVMDMKVASIIIITLGALASEAIDYFDLKKPKNDEN